METKADLHSFTPFVLTWHGAGKGPNRFYAWLDALSRLKEGVYRFIPEAYAPHVIHT